MTNLQPKLLPTSLFSFSSLTAHQLQDVLDPSPNQNQPIISSVHDAAGQLPTVEDLVHAVVI